MRSAAVSTGTAPMMKSHGHDSVARMMPLMRRPTPPPTPKTETPCRSPKPTRSGGNSSLMMP